MATENFTTYTEVDPNARVEVAADYIDWVAITRQESAYVYQDFGANYFAGGFEHKPQVYVSGSASGRATHWMLANAIGDTQALLSGDILYLYTYPSGGNWVIELVERDNGVSYTTSSSGHPLGSGNIRYLKIIRDESIGTYGTLYCYIYSDFARTILLATLALTLHTSTKDFRYLYGFSSINDGTGGTTHSARPALLTLTAYSSPTVTTQAVTAISGTTATGSGNITSLGVPNPTQHGHCWSINPTPTISEPLVPTSNGGRTENGAASATGAFTSAMTVLVAGTKYYVRAYATNAEGTSYGGQVEFWANKGTVFPTDPLTRVTSIIHRYDRRNAIYQLELLLGDTTSALALPYESSAARATAEKKQEQDSTPIIEEAVEKSVAKAKTPTPTVEDIIRRSLAWREERRKKSLLK